MSTVLEAPEKEATKLPPKPAAPSPRETDRGEMQLINPNLIVPSPFNTRKSRNAAADAELLNSVKQYGVIEPVLIRPAMFLPLHAQRLKELGIKTTFKPGDEIRELVAGERRWEAALRAGVTAIRAVEQDMRDEQAREIQVVENDQREDLDPIDRAEGYRNLYTEYLKSMSQSEAMERLKQKLGKERRAVYNVMSLANLTAEGQAVLRSAKIGQSHAYLIAPLTAVNQKNVLKWIEEETRYGEHVSVRDLKEQIREELFLVLADAPFDIKSLTLLAGAGACIQCPKNTAVTPDLDPEVKKPTCTDPVCYHQKETNHLHLVQIEITKTDPKAVTISSTNHRPKKGEPGAIPVSDWRKAESKKCAHAVTGIVIDAHNGYTPGDTFKVCINKSCKVHFDSISSYSAYDAPPRRNVPAGEMRKKVRANKLDQALRTARTKAFLESVTELKTDDLRVVAITTFDGLHHGLKQPLFSSLGWKWSGSVYGYGSAAAFTKQINAAKPAEVAKVLALMCVASHVLPGVRYANDSPGKLDDFDKRHKAGLQKVTAKVERELKDKFAEIDRRRKQKEKKETKAKPAAKGKKK